ncbi:MAG TPA: acyltransferase domain-containing protein, partial [Aquella sp.]|nr:acyltransferase domain-containing protein [Aquella sp.]
WSLENGYRRVAGVSSFGIGGTNAHIIISDYVNKLHGKHELLTPESGLLFVDSLLFPISAKSRKSLGLFKQNLVQYLSKHELSVNELRDIAYTLEAREDFQYRCCVAANNKEDLLTKLQDTPLVEALHDEKPKIVFMFPGQGSQYPNMAIELYQNDKQFKSYVNECILIANRYLEIDFGSILYPDIYPGLGEEDIKQTKWAQISLFVISYSLAKYLDLLGIKSNTYIGHSIGEYVAATLAGVFNLEDAIRLVIARGKAMQLMKPGRMLAIKSDWASLESVVLKHNCELAVINSPKDIVVSGTKADIDVLLHDLEDLNITAIQLDTSHAYHSRMMEEAAIQFEKEFISIKLNRPNKEFVSNLTGLWNDDEVLKKEYWSAQLRNRVEFNKGVETIYAKYPDNIIFVEVGTGKGLSSFIKMHEDRFKKTRKSIQLLPSFKESKDNSIGKIIFKEDLLSILWSYGVVSLNQFSTNDQLRINQELPTYQFEYKRCWIDKAKTRNKDITNDITLNIHRKRVIEEHYTDLEYKVAEVFCEILGCEEISLHDNFFHLGGNSISSIQLAGRLRQHLKLKISANDILVCKTIDKLCKKIVSDKLNMDNNSVVLNESGVLKGELGLLPIQEWFFSKVDSRIFNKANHWNQSFLIKTGQLDQDVLKHSLKKLIEYHDGLRLNYHVTADGKYIQKYSKPCAVELSYLNISKLTDNEYQEVLTNWQSGFELFGSGPLYHFGYLDGYLDGSSRIFLAFHHLIMDTVSWRIIVNDLRELYTKLS